MLVLTRKIGEEIRIGDDITVKVTSVQGGRVKLGIEAPRDRRITRSEMEPVGSPFGSPMAAEEDTTVDIPAVAASSRLVRRSKRTSLGV